MEMMESFQKEEKTLWKKEKLVVTSNSSFSNSVPERLVLQTCKNQGLFWKGLNTNTLHNIVSKPLAAFPPQNWSAGEKNEFYHDA